MSLDPEMQQWQSGWKAETPLTLPFVDVRAKAIRQEFRLKRLFAIEMSSAIVFLVGSLYVAYLDRSCEMILWAAYVWATTIIASCFSVWNWQSL